MLDLIKLIYDFISNGYNIYTVFILLIMLLIAGYIDYNTYKIPNKLNLLIILLRIAFIPFIGMINFQNIISCLFAFLFFLVPAMLLNHKMGGDIKCVTAVALFFNIYITILFLFISCILSFFTHFYLRKKFNTKLVPFAPFFCLSHIVLSSIYIAFMYKHTMLIGFITTITLILISIFIFDYKFNKNKKDLN